MNMISYSYRDHDLNEDSHESMSADNSDSQSHDHSSQEDRFVANSDHTETIDPAETSNSAAHIESVHLNESEAEENTQNYKEALKYLYNKTQTSLTRNNAESTRKDTKTKSESTMFSLKGKIYLTQSLWYFKILLCLFYLTILIIDKNIKMMSDAQKQQWEITIQQLRDENEQLRLENSVLRSRDREMVSRLADFEGHLDEVKFQLKASQGKKWIDMINKQFNIEAKQQLDQKIYTLENLLTQRESEFSHKLSELTSKLQANQKTMNEPRLSQKPKQTYF